MGSSTNQPDRDQDAPPAADSKPAIASIVSSWRALTGGTSRKIQDIDRRTLVACSGGADSSALALALASATNELVIAHVVHDLRPEDQANRDRDAAAELAAKLGLSFVEAAITPAALGGNAESVARKLRYETLFQLASGSSCRFIATAHHADDQFETMLMALMRGAGPRGLSGIAKVRLVSADLKLIRPMLSATRADALCICAYSDWTWVEDETNSDTSRLRAALRQTIIPELDRLRPGAAHRAVTAAQLQADSTALIDQHTADLMAAATRRNAQITWNRSDIADQLPILLGSLIRAAVAELCSGVGLDQLSSRTIQAITTTIADGQGQSREFELQSARVLVTQSSVTIRREK